MKEKKIREIIELVFEEFSVECNLLLVIDIRRCKLLYILR